MSDKIDLARRLSSTPGTRYRKSFSGDTDDESGQRVDWIDSGVDTASDLVSHATNESVFPGSATPLRYVDTFFLGGGKALRVSQYGVQSSSRANREEPTEWSERFTVSLTRFLDNSGNFLGPGDFPEPRQNRSGYVQDTYDVPAAWLFRITVQSSEPSAAQIENSVGEFVSLNRVSEQVLKHYPDVRHFNLTGGGDEYKIIDVYEWRATGGQSLEVDAGSIDGWKRHFVNSKGKIAENKLA